jgi:hypothetical protein
MTGSVGHPHRRYLVEVSERGGVQEKRLIASLLLLPHLHPKPTKATAKYIYCILYMQNN